MSEVLEKIRKALVERGGRTYGGLRRQGDKTISKAELEDGLLEFGIKLTKTELDAVFKELDTDGAGSVGVDEFFRAIRGTITGTRLAAVQEVWTKLTKAYGKDYLDVDWVKKNYKTKDEKNFTLFAQAFQPDEKTKDDKIDVHEWEEYYSRISSGIDNDDHFIQLVKKCWAM